MVVGRAFIAWQLFACGILAFLFLCTYVERRGYHFFGDFPIGWLVY
jgi:hypothetical protein